MFQPPVATSGAAPETTPVSTGSNFHAGGSGGVLLNTTDGSGARFGHENHMDNYSDADAASVSDSDDYAFDSDPDDDSESDHDRNHDHAHDNNADNPDSSHSPVHDGQAKTEQAQSDMRKRIVAIQQDQSISAQEKSKKIQELMTSQWASRQRRHSNRSAVASNRLDNKATDFGIITAANCQISYHDKDKTIIGCKHYQRSCKLQAHCCGKWFPCRFCHDEVSDHNIIRNLTVTMMCMFCLTVQPSEQICINPDCQKAVSKYYCKECKLWDNDPRKNIYHCYDCGICRIGKGLGQDYFHCKKCNVCMAISLKGKHKCIERNLESDCPICGEYMFTSTTTVIFMPCGHCIHYKCHQEYIQTSYQCPTCFKSLANMTEYFKRIDAMLGKHQMPPEYSNSFTYVYCNDCEKKCYAKFHFLYHKNLDEIILQTMEGKESTTLDTLNEALSPSITGPSNSSSIGGTVASTSTGESEILRESAIQSIRHISSATPGFSTSNTSVQSAGSQLSVPVSADSSLYASLNPSLVGESFFAVNEENILSRASSVRSSDQMDTSSHSSSVEE
ncbi:hypothetical protein HK100_002042 [Physocladia obscura]|uniref:Zf-CHY-domain-containing protein n=1 Tax=Physocladia obscura TaxID=109957 RepID=A0AAD5XAL4_9FUNG|nr:hypothetical protein HK100_002042 [Physocladia obscura]